MSWKTLLRASGATLLVAWALYGAARAETPGAPPSVRNESGRTLMCGAEAVGSAAQARVLLRAGRAWTADTGRAYLFACDFPGVNRTYRLRPGKQYRLVTSEGGSGRVLLQPVG